MPTMRGRTDTQAGLSPAFWSLGVGGQWPDNGEIAIMEYYRGNLLANLIWAAEGGMYRTASFTRRKPIDSFVISVDREVVNDSDWSHTANPDGKNGFRQAHSILLNLAIGGTAGEDPSATRFPARFAVDYVRI
jgi:beta-glucanase (GH16 family)